MSTVVQGLCAPLAGVLVDRVGPRPVILGGVLLVGGRHFGSYRLAFLTAIGCCAIAAACFWLARAPRLDGREAGVLTRSA